MITVTRILQTDKELQWARDNMVLVEIKLLGQHEDFDFIQNFNEYLIQLSRNRFYFREDVRIEVPEYKLKYRLNRRSNT